MADLTMVLNVVQQLADTCRDGQNGYRDAAEHVTDTNLRKFFNQQSLERAAFAGELEQELIRLGESHPDTSGSVAAGIRRAWIDVKTILGGGDETLLSSIEAGEDSAKKSYAEALANPNLPGNLAMLFRRQLAGIEAAHDHVRSLRDAKAA